MVAAPCQCGHGAAFTRTWFEPRLTRVCLPRGEVSSLTPLHESLPSATPPHPANLSACHDGIGYI